MVKVGIIAFIGIWYNVCRILLSGKLNKELPIKKEKTTKHY